MDFTSLPMGFGMMLSENQVALNVFNALSEEDRQKVASKAETAATATEMAQLVNALATKGGFL